MPFLFLAPLKSGNKVNIVYAVFIYIFLEQIILNHANGYIYLFLKILPELVIYSLLIYVILKNFSRGVLWVKTGVEVPFFVFMLVSFLSCVINDTSLVLGAIELRTYTRFIAVFFIITQAGYRLNLKKLGNVLLIIIIFELILGSAQFYGTSAVDWLVAPKDISVEGVVYRNQKELYQEQEFVSGSLFRYGIYGSTLALFFSLAYPIYKASSLRVWRVISIASFCGVVISFARKAWISVLLSFFGQITRISKGVKIIMAIMPFIAIFLMSQVTQFEVGEETIGEKSKARILSVFDYEYIKHTFERTRGHILVSVSGSVLKESPFLGFGPGNVGSSYSGTSGGTEGGYTSTIVNRDFYDERWLLLTDVGLVNILAQTGTLGLISFLTIIAVVFFKAYKLLRARVVNVEEKWLAYGFINVVPIMLFLNVFGFAFSYRSTSMFFWLVAGFVSSIHLRATCK